MAKFATLAAKAAPIAKTSKSSTSGASTYDASTYTGKLGTLSGAFRWASDKHQRVRLMLSSEGKGSPYASVYFASDDDRISEVMAGISFGRSDFGEPVETSNGRYKLVLAWPHPTSGKSADVETLTIGGFDTVDMADGFVSVRIKATEVPTA